MRHYSSPITHAYGLVSDGGRCGAEQHQFREGVYVFLAVILRMYNLLFCCNFYFVVFVELYIFYILFMCYHFLALAFYIVLYRINCRIAQLVQMEL